ncbi:MAG: hypothetical protein KDD55_13485, partial [Bdellovibrionales bacterium]|nr:hypothetical protein [Bdellovibrionales bacterium]
MSNRLASIAAGSLLLLAHKDLDLASESLFASNQPSQPAAEQLGRELTTETQLLFEYDLETGTTSQEALLAKINLDEAINLCRSRIQSLPSDSDAQTKLRCMHAAIHEIFGWGVDSQNRIVAGIARKELDCDLFALVYHEVGAALAMPLELVFTVRKDGRNHAFVTYQSGSEFYALETRADPGQGTQVLHWSEQSLLLQYEKSSGLEPYSTPFLAASGKEVLAFRIYEMRGDLPSQFRNQPNLDLDLLMKATGLNLDQIQSYDRPYRQLFQEAMQSPELTAREQDCLRSIFQYRELLVQDMLQYSGSHPFTLGWTAGALEARDTCIKLCAESAARTDKFNLELRRIRSIAAAFNAES